MLWVAALMLAAANFIAVLNMTIANVAVPNIAGALGAATSQGTWVITSYAVGEAITVPLTGWPSARFGSVRVFVSSMILFGVFSIVCSLADRDQGVRQMLVDSGATPDAAHQVLDYLVTSQSVMLSTNQIMTAIGLLFLLAAAVIWLAPKPGRILEPGAGRH